MGITIIDVKIVDVCSKCRKPNDKIPQDKNSRAYTDEEIACISCAVGGKDLVEKENEK